MNYVNHFIHYIYGIENRRPSRSVRQAIESIEDRGKPINLVRIFNWSLLSTSGFPI